MGCTHFIMLVEQGLSASHPTESRNKGNCEQLGLALRANGLSANLIALLKRTKSFGCLQIALTSTEAAFLYLCRIYPHRGPVAVLFKFPHLNPGLYLRTRRVLEALQGSAQPNKELEYGQLDLTDC
jgi:hypothetical protein